MTIRPVALAVLILLAAVAAPAASARLCSDHCDGGVRCRQVPGPARGCPCTAAGPAAQRYGSAQALYPLWPRRPMGPV